VLVGGHNQGKNEFSLQDDSKPPSNQYLESQNFSTDGYLDYRRNTEKLANIRQTPIAAYSELEKVEEEIDYTKGYEYSEGSVGQWFNALNNISGKVIVVKVLKFDELTQKAVDARFNYLEQCVEKAKRIQNENVINYFKVIKQDK